MKKLIILFKIVFTLLLLYLVLRNINLLAFYNKLSSLKPEYIFWAFLFYFLLVICLSIRWNILLRTIGINISFRRAFSTYLMMLFFNNFLPSTVGGDVIRIYDIIKLKGNSAKVIASTIVDRIVGMLGIITLPLILIFFIPKKFIPLKIGFINLASLLIVFALLLLIFWILLKSIPLVFKKEFFEKLTAYIKELIVSFEYYRNYKFIIFKTYALTLIIQMLAILMNYAIFKGLGFTSISFLYFCFAIPLATLVATIPITINGLGLRENAYVILLHTPKAAFLSLTLYAIFAIASLTGALIYVLRRT